MGTKDRYERLREQATTSERDSSPHTLLAVVSLAISLLLLAPLVWIFLRQVKSSSRVRSNC